MRSRHRITHQVRCEGVEKGRELPQLEHVACMTLTLLGTRAAGDGQLGCVDVDITACELDECAEPLVIGLQDLHKWGMQLME